MTFHKLIAWSIVFFSWLHTIAHWVNFARLAMAENLGFKGWLIINFRTGPGATGYVMMIALMAMVFTAIEKPRRKNFERFWYVHHLFLVFFFAWSFHGAFCMIKPDTSPFCSGIGVFWKYWLVGGLVYGVERLLREIRGTHKTYISKVIQHPSKVCEIQIRKENFKPKAGQYIFLCCPEISLWQYHPFTLTSAPEEEYVSVHIRCVGDFTTALATKLGCDFSKGVKGVGDKKIDHRVSRVVGVDRQDTTEYDPGVDRVLPRGTHSFQGGGLMVVMIDGPFGSASEDFQKYEVVILVGAGIGVTPFASILKSIWYRVNYPTQKRTKLRKVHFFWVPSPPSRCLSQICRDFESFEWFRSLLAAIEAQDIGDLIEIHTYLTQRVKEADAINIMVNDAGAEVDAITGLKAPTNFGRPNWDR
jgi:NADPH oxidase 2